LLCRQKNVACAQKLFSQSINVLQVAAEVSTHLIAVVYTGRGINVYVVHVCVGSCEVLVVVEIEILVCWVVTHTTTKVVTLGSEKCPIFIFWVGW
jgi:hypothetical protein